MLRSVLHSNSHGTRKILDLRVLLCPISAQKRFMQLPQIHSIQSKANVTTAQIEGQSGTQLCSSPMAAGVQTAIEKGKKSFSSFLPSTKCS